MNKTQLYEILFVLVGLAILFGLTFFVVFVRRQISKNKNSIIIKIILATALIAEYLVLLLWVYNAWTYKIGYHSELLAGWLCCDQHLSVINTIDTPYWWILLILMPFTFSFDSHFLENRKTSIQILIRTLIPIIIILGTLTFNYYISKTHPPTEENRG